MSYTLTHIGINNTIMLELYFNRPTIQALLARCTEEQALERKRHTCSNNNVGNGEDQSDSYDTVKIPEDIYSLQDF